MPGASLLPGVVSSTVHSLVIEVVTMLVTGRLYLARHFSLLPIIFVLGARAGHSKVVPYYNLRYPLLYSLHCSLFH